MQELYYNKTVYPAKAAYINLLKNKAVSILSK